MFLQEFGSRLSPTVTFIDPVGNEFNIKVETEGDNKFFVGGMRGLMFYYRFDDGGWVNLCYTGASEFHIIKIEDREQHEVTYLTPPISFDISRLIAKPDPVDYTNDSEFSKFEMFHEVKLTKSHITDNRKVFYLYILHDSYFLLQYYFVGYVFNLYLFSRHFQQK